MTTFRLRLSTAGAGIAVAAVTASLLAPAAGAAPGAATRLGTTAKPLAAAAGWLSTQFTDGSHLPAPTGNHFGYAFGKTYYVNYGENADVIFGLAAAKSGARKVGVALGYLRDHLEAYTDYRDKTGYGPYDGAIAKTALAAEVAGRSPRAFGGVDLIAKLRTDECDAADPNNGCPAAGSARNIFASISESLAVLAEARAGVSVSPHATKYFLSLQCAGGGFTTGTSTCGSGKADIDSTSYAIMALDALGGHAKARAKAAAWLRSKQAADGAWRVQDVKNTNSTGLAAAALGKSGAAVAARTWLREQQVPAGRPGAGALKYAGTVDATTSTSTSPSVLATAQGLTGLAANGSLARLKAAKSAAGSRVFAPTASVDKAKVSRHSKQTVTGTGFAAGENVQVRLAPKKAVLGHAEADPLGSVTITYSVPKAVASGKHTVRLTGVSSGLHAAHAVTVTKVTR